MDKNMSDFDCDQYDIVLLRRPQKKL